MNIRVTDTLAANLDLSTFELIGYSHQNITKIVGNELTVYFPTINLADSTTDLHGSEGYFQYRIKPIAGLPGGTIIHNAANIYFDYNAPIRTNTSANNFLLTLGMKEISNNDVSIYPNPAVSIFKIESLKYKIESIKIYNVLGETIDIGPLKIDNEPSTVDISKEAKGVYFVEVKTLNGVVRKKLVKE